MPAPALPLIDHIYSIRIATRGASPDARQDVLVVRANHVVICYIVKDLMGKFPVSQPINFSRTLPTLSWNQLLEAQMLRRSTEEDLA